MPLLDGLVVLQVGPGAAAAVAGRLLADVGATVRCVAPDRSRPLAEYLDHGKDAMAETLPEEAVAAAVQEADLVFLEGSPPALAAQGLDLASLRALNATATIVAIGPYGAHGPAADRPASDLTLFCASGIARLLTGQVDDLSEPPVRPVGQQSAFIAGIAAACAGMHGVLLGGQGADVDVSAQEALATLVMTELAQAGLHGRAWSRKRLTDGNGATVCILPASDGYVAISPRENHQWESWLKVMGDPAWGREPRFAKKPDRVANWDALHALMSQWSRQHPKRWIADRAQDAHVPSFPLQEPADQFVSPQLDHRGFFREVVVAGRTLKAPGSPFGIAEGEGPAPSEPGPVARPERGDGPLPLSGVRVLDFSWVIAGPTATRYLAAMGADVIKVEAPGRGDPGRGSELHTVLGQAKRGVVLNLKTAEGADLARRLAANCDVVIENFATGVMDRLGLGAPALRQENPRLIYLSASGLGRTGPEAGRVAYGTLLQCYAGFAGLNGHAERPPRVGVAWLDPMCGLMLAFITAAAIWRRRSTGTGVRIDFSMVEAMLWTMAEPLLATQTGPAPERRGNWDEARAPHGVYPCAGEDGWVGIAVTGDTQWRALCALVPALHGREDLAVVARRAAAADIDGAIAAWTEGLAPAEAAAKLVAAGVPAAPVVTSLDLLDDPHLLARGFWEESGGGYLPALPWQASFGRKKGAAPGLGADTDAVLTEVLGLSAAEIAALRAAGALG